MTFMIPTAKKQTFSTMQEFFFKDKIIEVVTEIQSFGSGGHSVAFHQFLLHFTIYVTKYAQMTMGSKLV